MSDDDRTTPRKDRLIQTRVPSNLESTLKEEARKQRLSVSHLIRNILEDTFHLVDNVVVEVDNIVNDSVGLATQLRRDAQRLASSARGLRGAPHDDHRPEAHPTGASSVPPSTGVPDSTQVAADGDLGTAAVDPLAHIYAWNPVVLNRAEVCSKCGKAMAKGDEAFIGMSDDPTKPRAWLCGTCSDAL